MDAGGAMIIVRSPMRISLAGGGTDLPSYYARRDGFAIGAAIDKYVYITVHQTFLDHLIVKYSRLERATDRDGIEHPIVREALRTVEITECNLEITSLADLPAGAGLGSSGSFTTALLRALHTYRRNLITPEALAAQACEIEIDRLGEPVGKQDQYIAALGGITCMTFHASGRVEASALPLAPETLHTLEDHLCAFFTGYTRSAGRVLSDQDRRTRAADEDMLRNLDEVRELAFRARDALIAGRLDEYAELMDQHWQQKRTRSSGISSEQIDEWYDLGRSNGALGGKLVGAGGGGFLVFYARDPLRLRRAMTEAGLPEVRFRFDQEGTKVIVQ
jgi:D-glycero-alpha-D-manno-heptose-7-phosphate kinase